jgi:hypothetical protein
VKIADSNLIKKPLLKKYLFTQIETFIALLIASFLASMPKAIATNILQVRLGGNSPIIPITQGQGVTISFIPSRQIVQKVWLDDPTWLTVDTDGCLEGLGNERCEQSGATSVHLRRIKPLRIEGLPSAEISLLTIVTRDVSGNLEISTFKLQGATSAQHSVVEVVPSTEIGLLNNVDTTLVRKGKSIAIAQGWLREGDRLSQKIDQFITFSKTESAQAAAKRAGLSIALIERLSSLGSNK